MIEKVFSMLGYMLGVTIFGAIRLTAFGFIAPWRAVRGTRNETQKLQGASKGYAPLPDTVLARVEPDIPEAERALVIREAPDIEQPRMQATAAERVRVAEIVGPQGLQLGVMWIYLYSSQGIARRVFKVRDAGLAKALGRDRFYYPDVPFAEKDGTDGILKDFHAEIAKFLDRSKPVIKARAAEKVRRDQSALVPKVKQVTATVQAPKPQRDDGEKHAPPVIVDAPKSEAIRMNLPSGSMPFNKRQVQGESYEGSVTLAGKTTRIGKDGPYQTYCLTLHNGNVEIPLFGAELGRQASDLNIQVGEKVRVVFMGRQPMAGEGAKGYKNLYQVSRMSN